jgi:hypothetical protein
MDTRNEQDARDWIVEYAPAGETAFVPVADFIQSEGRAAHRLALARAKKKAEGDLVDRWYALEQEKERVRRRRTTWSVSSHARLRVAQR